MKKIVINGEYYASQEKPTGIARHMYEILREMDQFVQPGEVIILAPKCGFDPTQFKNIEFRMKGSFSSRAKQHFWKFVLFPAYCFLNNAVSVNLGLSWKFFNFDVMSIYDCTHELFPDIIVPATQKWYDNLRKNQMRNSQKCEVLLTDSMCAKSDIKKLYHIDSNRIKVVSCGWQHFERIVEEPQILEKLGLSDKQYFLSVGSRFPHKNIKWISYAAKKNPQYTFVVSGSRLGRKNTYFEGEIPDNMIFTGYLSDGEIKSLMRHCKAFIQPSLYEGFGIPPMEAMSVGADCIVSTGGSLPEVYKNSVWYINPYDYEHIDLDEIMSKPKESNELILNKYSWKKSAEKLYSILKELAG